MLRHRWLDSEILMLKENYANKSLKELAILIKHPIFSIIDKARDLSLSRKYFISLTEQQEQKFAHDYLNLSYEELLEKYNLKQSRTSLSNYFQKIKNKYGITGNKNSVKFSQASRKKKQKTYLPEHHLFGKYKYSAKERSIEFQLSFEEFQSLVRKNCFYCNTKPQQRVKHKKDIGYFNGIDRLDNNKEYILSNCVSCCKLCNTAKMSLSLEEFKSHINKIYKYFIKKRRI